MFPCYLYCIGHEKLTVSTFSQKLSVGKGLIKLHNISDTSEHLLLPQLKTIYENRQ